jgi:hypothetical protein
MSRQSHPSWLVERNCSEARQYAAISFLQLLRLPCIQMLYISSILFSDALNLSFSLRATDYLFFLICIVGVESKLGPLGNAAIYWPIVPARVIVRMENLVE